MLPQRQDDYLDRGYFRSAHTIRQTRFLFLKQQLWSTVWSRVPLQTYTLKKRQRKLDRSVRSRFQVHVQRYQPSRAQDELYAIYQASHPLDVAKSLPEVLGQHNPTHRFRTHSLQVYDGDRLAAFSCFDLGDETLASIFGCYHPDYTRDSLGSFTMLGELDFGRQQGLTYYHPGYCVPGVAAFDYKLRLPDLEGKTFVTDHWLPMEQVLAKALPHQTITEHIQLASQQLVGAGVPHRRVQMPLCEMMDEIADGYGPFNLPLMLELTATNPLGEVYIAYDPALDEYQLWYGQPVGDLRFEPGFEGLVAEVAPEANLKFYQWRSLVARAHDFTHLLPLTRGRQLLRTILDNLPLWAIAGSTSEEEE